VIWETGTGVHGITPFAVGSDFVVWISGVNNQIVRCIEDSDGSTRWEDLWTRAFHPAVDADDRVYACGRRFGP
jgi:hypothetical protein